MNEYSQKIALRWADLDPNYHVRHSVYYDWGATIRTDVMNAKGLTLAVMQDQNFGPVLFREECVFKREIRFGDELTINYKALKIRKDFARFSMIHEIAKTDGTLCATITVEGAWMDTNLRKLTTPPLIGQEMVEGLPKAANFEWIEIPN
ncbi:MAG: acyl-CoA thioesterase [Cytophagales bacterium]